MLFYLRIVACMILRIQTILEPKHPQCNHRGTFDPCGTCKCEPDFYGDMCECEANYRIPDRDTAMAACTDSGSAEPCNGRGECKCGSCECFSRGSNITESYYGRYCECDDFSCPKHEGKLCGGHGSCSCGRCSCDTRYKGDACEKMSSAGEGRKSLFGPNKGKKKKNICKMAFSCEECLDMPYSCGWYKHIDLPNHVKSHCNLYDKHLSLGISADNILTSETTPNITIIEPQSDKCGGHGSVDSCGQCKCDPGYYGLRCECDGRIGMTTESAIQPCIRPGSTNKYMCSGRGDCVCGKCQCFHTRANSMTRYSGQFCECDDYSCSYSNNIMCGGHGRCVCGECQCDTGYSGEACDCTTDTSTCKSSNGLLCNGHGSCICGVCVCKGTFRGPKCEDCPIQEHEFASELCSYRGTNMCGHCVCNVGHYGKACECDVTSGITEEEVMSQCISPNSTTGAMCSGRGECICGFCSCNPLRSQSSQVYSGQFCECNDYSCSYSNNRMCAGHGRCSCGQCECEPGYTGEACECPTSFDSCMASNGMICNEVGNCVCGECLCEPHFYGDMCECEANYRIPDRDTAMAACTDYGSAEPCNGNGECKCGSCKCFSRGSNMTESYYGRYCECDDLSCPKHEGKLCGVHGRCSCGRCSCDTRFKGDACEKMSPQGKRNICKMAFSCEECLDMPYSCGWYKHIDLPNNVKSYCNLYDKHLSLGISADDILTSETTPNITIIEPQSDNCGGHGSVDSCGQCKCDQGYYGLRCECDGRFGMTTESALQPCIRPGSTNGYMCSGRGDCVCGKCQCFHTRANSMTRYSGQFCECDDYSCSYSNNIMCGGHGRCVCGECQCDTGYSGEACDCTTDTSTCKSSNGLLCNGHGSCICGVCVCEGTFRGPKCEDCPIQEHEFTSELCSYRGTNMCGHCVCNVGHYGKACECDVTSGITEEEVMSQCISPNSTTGVMCSGRGECICGFCSCNPLRPQSSQVYSGQFCECNDYSCSYSNNRMCAGHGRCSCGQCECEPGYTGEACECPTSSDSCMASNGMICNEVGNCVCGECFCEPHFYGDMCECEANYRIPDRDTAMAACTDYGSAEPCNGRGECKCGSCECFSRRSNMTESYYGRYCECDDLSCPKHEGKLCGGKRNICKMAFSCEECLDMPYSCGWYKHIDLPNNVKSHCNLYDKHLSLGISADDILTSETTPNITIIEPQSDKCGGHGSVDSCGQCKCDPGYYGLRCECDGRIGMTTESAIQPCIRPGSTNGYMCSGRGNCVCGKCQCLHTRANSMTRYSGQFCECDDYSCSYSNNIMCGGHGRCVCGECQCDTGYSGEACDCTTDTSTCKSGNGLLCNGHGSCMCGMCLCEGTYRGQKCKDCPIQEHEYASELCSYRGTNMCGDCDCDEGHYGKACECEVMPGMTREEVMRRCISPNSTSTVMCSGRGECICGFCSCNPLRPQSSQVYSGQFCECNDYSCSYSNNRMCAGHGRCSCGQCECEPGYTGEACECPTPSDSCIASNGMICNGWGNCSCGKCVCDSYFRGPTCEECPTCPGVCQTYKSCVFCILGSGEYTQEYCSTNCQIRNIEIVDSLNLDGEDGGETPAQCSYWDETDDVNVLFTYTYDDFNQILIKVQRRDMN